MASKRSFNLSTGDTRGKPKEKLCFSGSSTRKCLFQESNKYIKRNAKSVTWSKQETSMLIQYICLYWKDAWTDKWPNTKDITFSDGCAQAINNACKSQHTGSACRTCVLKSLSKEYKTLSEAENVFEIDYVLHSMNTNECVPSSPGAIFNFNDNLLPIFKESPNKYLNTKISSTVGDVNDVKEQMVNYIFKLFVIEFGGNSFYQFVHANFITKSLSAMKTLFQEDKKNLLYSLAKCFEKQEDGSGETRMPLDCMPYGLIDYNLRFFAAENSQKLGIEDHYVQWLSTMFAHFGHKWICLFRGPYWQYNIEDHPDESEIPSTTPSNIIENALNSSGINFTMDGVDMIDNNFICSGVPTSEVEVQECASQPTQDNDMTNINAPYLWSSLQEREESQVPDLQSNPACMDYSFTGSDCVRTPTSEVEVQECASQPTQENDMTNMNTTVKLPPH